MVFKREIIQIVREIIVDPDTDHYIRYIETQILKIYPDCIINHKDLGQGFCEIIISSYFDIGYKFSWIDEFYETIIKSVNDNQIYINRYITKCKLMEVTNQTNQSISGY